MSAELDTFYCRAVLASADYGARNTALYVEVDPVTNVEMFSLFADQLWGNGVLILQIPLDVLINAVNSHNAKEA